ncbi:MAG TPA: 5'/3'-nucleotidase SurE [Candidatus Limnocylindrales bacterium]|nr:5'/3'-nucleotidase SurE [Candidatus Limnocylindrales bacterium]
MRILVSNDDGIYSPGLATLAKVARRFGDVRVVAPDVEQSSASHAITASKPLRYRATKIIDGVEAYRVNGTPADCVALGSYNWEKVDVVLSGINLGPNLGNALWHSGTLAAAKQAALLGLRGIAFSTPVESDDPDLSPLAECVERVLEILLPQDELKLINVNLPPRPRGIRWTRQAVEQYDGRVLPGDDPMGRRHYWFTVVPLDDPAEGTDLWAMSQGYISMTPLRLDLTNHAALQKVEADTPVVEFDATMGGDGTDQSDAVRRAGGEGARAPA